MSTAVYICTNEQHIPLGHIFMSSWVASNSQPVDFYWFVDDESLISELQATYPEITVLLTNRTERVNNTSLSDSFFYGMSLKIFALPYFIGRYDRVIYLDVDTIVNKDPIDLLNLDMGGKKVAGVRDIATHHWPSDKPKPLHLRDEFSRRSDFCSDPYSYVNSGVLVFDMSQITTLPDHDALADEHSFVLTDKDYINYVFDGDIMQMPDTFNFMADQAYNAWMTLEQRLMGSLQMREAVIQHFHGQAKPWHEGSAYHLLTMSQINTEQFRTHCDAVEAQFGANWVSAAVANNKKFLELNDSRVRLFETL